MAGSEGSKGAVMAALFANGGIAVTKFIASFMSGSSAMLAEAFHSVVDTFNQVCLLIGFKRSERPADEQHPFGYGGEAFFWGFIVAILLFSLGAGISFYEGIRALLHGGHGGSEGFPWINIGVLAIAFAFEAYALHKAWKEFQKIRRGEGLLADLRSLKDPSILVVLGEDTAALTGIVVAAAGVLVAWATGNPFWDALASIGVGIVLGLTAVGIAFEMKALLIGEAARPAVAEHARELVAGYEETTGVNEVRTLHIGPQDVLVSISADFDDATNAGRVEEIVTEIDASMREKFDEVKVVFVEVQSRKGHLRMAEAQEGDPEPA